MTHDQIRQLVEEYDRRLALMGMEPCFAEGPYPDVQTRLSHIRWMCQEVSRTIAVDPWDEQKIHRWFGFIQGVLSWVYPECFSVDAI